MKKIELRTQGDDQANVNRMDWKFKPHFTRQLLPGIRVSSRWQSWVTLVKISREPRSSIWMSALLRQCGVYLQLTSSIYMLCLRKWQRGGAVVCAANTQQKGRRCDSGPETFLPVSEFIHECEWLFASMWPCEELVTCPGCHDAEGGPGWI